MVRIRRFGVIKTATVAAVMYAVIILVFTLLFGLPVVLITGAAANGSGATAGILGGGIAGVLFLGVFGAVAYGIGGWIITAIACLFYNLVAGWVGGVELQLESTAAPVAPQWGGPYGGYAQQQPVYPQPQGYPPSAPGAQPPAPQPPAQYPPAGYGQG